MTSDDLENRDDTCAGIWVAANTHQHREPLAVVNLQRQGFEAYCPMIRRRLRHAGRTQNALRPLFPGYVFVRLNPDRSQWRSITSTIGIRTLIKFGDRLGVLPLRFIEGLREREEDGAVPIPRVRESYDPGDAVKLRDGPLDGLIATVVSCDTRGRLQLLLGLLAGGVRIRSTVDSVVPAVS